MDLFTRACRCVLACTVAFLLGGWLFNLELSPFMPATWTFGQVEVASAVILGVAGIAFGALAAFVVTRGESLPGWPVGAYIAGAATYAWFAAGDIQGVVVSEPMGLRWLWWSLVALTPAIGALLVLVLSRNSSGPLRVGGSTYEGPQPV
jgi:hypothetical protein